MDGQETQSTHIIIQSDENPQEFEADQSNRAFVMKVDNASSDDTLSERNILQNLITAPHDRSKSNDVNTDSTVSFEIIQESLGGDSLFGYPVFPQEESRFDEQIEGQRLSASPSANDDSSCQTSADKCENDVIGSYPITTTSSSEVIDKTTMIPSHSVSVSFSSLELPAVANASCASTLIELETHPSTSNEISNPEDISTSETVEKSKEGDVIKKTVVEAFVKMVVCRKITVQKVDSKTGVVLSVDVHTEEEEPVVLGVDCVETTEDVGNGNSSKLEAKTKSGSGISSKLGASIDGGLKFLSAVSESRQKINPSLIGNALLQSSLPKSITNALCSENTQPPAIEGGGVRCSLSGIHIKTENIEQLDKSQCIQIKADAGLVDELNIDDDSADYIPPYERKLLKKQSRTSRIPNEHVISKEAMANDKDYRACELPTGLEHEKTGSSILLPKKRGRKRRWDKALGLVANLKTCQFCNKHFESVKACTRHMKKGECISALFCYICSKPFSSEELLEKHIMSHGTSPKTSSFECSDCRRSYRTKAGYMKHFRMGTCSKRNEFEDGETGDFPCELCGSRFSTVEYLKLHRYKVHENPKDLHNCPDCGKKFHSFLGFQRHREGRSCTEPLKCLICGKTYKAKESFKLHMKHHKSEISGVTFDCDTCGRSYMTLTALTKHKLSHTGVKPYKCDTCDKQFAMRYQVKDHARMHSGERPYLCNLCGTSFSNKGHLGRHLRSHENGTLLRRGRPKRVRGADANHSNSRDSGLKLIDMGQTLQTIDGQTIQVVNSQLFDSTSSNPPMIIQADNNTIIISDGWPAANAVPLSQPVSSTLPNESD